MQGERIQQIVNMTLDEFCRILVLAVYKREIISKLYKILHISSSHSVQICRDRSFIF